MIAANGIRLVLDEQRTTETPTLKSGQPGKTKVTYGEPEDALKWLRIIRPMPSRGLCRVGARRAASWLVTTWAAFSRSA